MSYPRKLVRTEQEHRRTLQLNKPTGSDMAAPRDALSASTPETTDGAKPEDRTARRALKDSERPSIPLKNAKGSLRKQTRE